jgi:hypothetical protein
VLVSARTLGANSSGDSVYLGSFIYMYRDEIPATVTRRERAMVGKATDLLLRGLSVVV